MRCKVLALQFIAAKRPSCIRSTGFTSLDGIEGACLGLQIAGSPHRSIQIGCMKIHISESDLSAVGWRTCRVGLVSLTRPKWIGNTYQLLTINRPIARYHLPFTCCLLAAATSAVAVAVVPSMHGHELPIANRR